MTEWVTQGCGCRLYTGLADLPDNLNPTCQLHAMFTCIICGDDADRATISHGTLATMHTPKETT